MIETPLKYFDVVLHYYFKESLLYSAEKPILDRYDI